MRLLLPRPAERLPARPTPRPRAVAALLVGVPSPKAETSPERKRPDAAADVTFYARKMSPPRQSIALKGLPQLRPRLT